MNRCLCRLRPVSWFALGPLLLIAWSGSVSAATLVVGTNVNTSRLTNNQSEAVIAMDPTKFETTGEIPMCVSAWSTAEMEEALAVPKRDYLLG